MVALRVLTLLLCFLCTQGFRPRENIDPNTEITQKYGNLACIQTMCPPANYSLGKNVCTYMNFCWYPYVRYTLPCNSYSDLSYCAVNPNVCSDSMCTAPPPQASTYPGESCTANISCTTDFCDPATHLCVGAAAGAFCLDSSHCGEGLYCSGKQCVPQLVAGQACSFEYECQNNLGCNTTTRWPGTCVPYFSVPLGGVVANCGNNNPYQSALCMTGSCLLTSSNYNNGIGLCIDAIKSLSPVPQTCLSNSDCVGDADGEHFVGSCNCGINNAATAYCSPFLGDLAGHDVLFYYNSAIQSNLTSQCNTLRRFNPKCFSSLPVPWGHTAAKAIIYYENYGNLQNNDICVKQTITNYYWYYNAAAQVLVLAALAVF